MGASLGDIALGLSALGLVRGPGVGLVGDLSAGVTNLSARLDGINYLNLFNGKKKKRAHEGERWRRHSGEWVFSIHPRQCTVSVVSAISGSKVASRGYSSQALYHPP